MAFILHKHTDHGVDTTEVSRSLLRIGRGTNTDLRFDNDAVDLEHAQIQQQDGHSILVDKNSVTGTYVNGDRVQSARLTDGDQITIGLSVLTIHLASPDEPLSVDIKSIALSAAPRGSLEALQVDYTTAYSLNRKFLNKTLLTLLLILAGASVLGNLLWTGQTQMFRPGSVSTAHTLFANQCSRCHQSWHGPSEEACQTCHAGPVHHAEQVFTPPCVSCHAEHRGRPVLAQVANRHCVQCHADLQAAGSKSSRFETRLTDFGRDHPEFALTVRDGSNQKRVRFDEQGARQSDRAKIAFSHEMHVDLPMTCKDCHEPAANGIQLAPVTYEVQCKRCHKLVFDPQFPDQFVPHAPPEEVRAFLLMTFAQGQNERSLTPKQTGRPTGPATSPPQLALTSEVFQRVQAAEKRLYRRTCTECHQVDTHTQPLPAIAKTSVPAVWFPHARFSHKAHRAVSCISCHMGVAESEEVSDVLLPGIQVCRECHQAAARKGRARQEHASADCVTCHLYHDKSQEREWNGSFTVQSLSSVTEQKKPGQLFDALRGKLRAWRNEFLSLRE